MSFNRVVDRVRSRSIAFKDLSVAGGKGAKPGRKEAVAETVRDEAFIAAVERDAYQKGFESGRMAGLEMADQKVDAIMGRLQESLEHIATVREQLIADARMDIVRLAVEIAKKLTRREISLDEEILLTLVRVAVDRVSTKAPAVVYLCREDYAFIQGRMAASPEVFGDRDLSLKVREDLKRGDCIVESPYGSVDARISEQFNRIEQGLLGQF